MCVCVSQLYSICCVIWGSSWLYLLTFGSFLLLASLCSGFFSLLCHSPPAWVLLGTTEKSHSIRLTSDVFVHVTRM